MEAGDGLGKALALSESCDEARLPVMENLETMRLGGCLSARGDGGLFPDRAPPALGRQGVDVTGDGAQDARPPHFREYLAIHSRASFCASAIWRGGIHSADPSLISMAFFDPYAEARLYHMCAWI